MEVGMDKMHNLSIEKFWNSNLMFESVNTHLEAHILVPHQDGQNFFGILANKKNIMQRINYACLDWTVVLLLLCKYHTI